MKIRVAPTEPIPLKSIGESSSIPESFGADVLWETNGRLIGIQRKEVGDMISSVRDNRLMRGLIDMGALDQAIFLLEGRPQWTNDGVLLNGHVKWTMAEHVGVMMGVQAAGVWCVTTANLQETCAMVPVLADWTSRTDHNLLTVRSGPSGDDWGRVSKRQRQEFILQGLPGVGKDRARRIIEGVGFPLGLVVEEEALLKVDGIGKGTLKKMREALS